MQLPSVVERVRSVFRHEQDPDLDTARAKGMSTTRRIDRIESRILEMRRSFRQGSHQIGGLF